MVLGLFFLLEPSDTEADWRSPEQAVGDLLSVGFLLMIGWLMKMANSATSLATLTLGVGTMVVLGSGLVSKRSVGTFVVVSLLIAVAAEFTFGLYEEVIGLLGRDPSLTDRTYVWADALALQNRPILGVGVRELLARSAAGSAMGEVVVASKSSSQWLHRNVLELGFGRVFSCSSQ